MKYAIVIPDGCADEPQNALAGETPLQAARTPNMDAAARAGVVGLMNNVPARLTAASDVATLSLFGYDPEMVYTGRAPLEVAAMGVALGPNDWAVRCNLVTVEDGRMGDFTAGHISSEEGAQLVAALQEKLGGPVEIEEPLNLRGTLEFHAGVSYRNIMVYRAGDGHAPFGGDTQTQPPHDIPDQPVAEYLPSGSGGWLLQDLMLRSRDVFAGHPVNDARRAAGKKPATQAWLWGQGRAPHIEPFAAVYGKRGAIISGVDLVRGVGRIIGWARVDVPGATGYLDTNYAGKGQHAVEALKDHDLVCVHVEAPDEASHEGRVSAKVAALEEIDRHIVGPLLEALKSHGRYRLLVAPDHRTLLRTKAHAHGPVPFAACGTGIDSRGAAAYDEVAGKQGDFHFDPGYRLMRWFIGR